MTLDIVCSIVDTALYDAVMIVILNSAAKYSLLLAFPPLSEFDHFYSDKVTTHMVSLPAYLMRVAYIIPSSAFPHKQEKIDLYQM